MTRINLFSFVPRRPSLLCHSFGSLKSVGCLTRTKNTFAPDHQYKPLKSVIRLKPSAFIFRKRQNSLVQTRCMNDPPKSYLSCSCPANVDCVIGMLLNYSPVDRENWIKQNLMGFIIACSSVSLEQAFHLRRITDLLDQIDNYNFCSPSKIIEPDDFYKSLASYYSPLPRVPVATLLSTNSPNTENVSSPRLLVPIVCVFLNKKTGKRLFSQSQGLSSPTQKKRQI